MGVTLDYNHAVLPLSNVFALGTHETAHLFNAIGHGVTTALDSNVLDILQRDCAEAIPKGNPEAGVLVKEEVTCFMHINQAWKQVEQDGEMR